MITLLGTYLHDIDPYAIRLPQGWWSQGIRWYGLSYLGGFVISYLLIRRVTKVGISTLSPLKVGDLIFVLLVGVMVGGRLGYVLFYEPSLLSSFTGRFPYWGLLAINEGGMASHGGIIGTIIACAYFARRHGHSMPHMLDLLAFSSPLGLFLGRIANFINGELYGRPCSPKLPWAVHFPQEMFTWSTIQWDRVSSVIDQFIGVEEVIAQIQIGNHVVISAVRPWLTPRHPSQIYAALLEGLFVFGVLAMLWIKPRKPGLIGAAFCITYGVVRIIGEQFRQPDNHIGYQWLNLTRGQWLSIYLIIAGILLAIAFAIRKIHCMGGWRQCEKNNAR